MKRLLAQPITHREIPLQIGLEFTTYEDMLNNNGEIEEHNPERFPDYSYNHDVDNMEWRLQDQNN